MTTFSFEAPYLPNPCEYLHNPYITRNYIHRTTFLLLIVWVYLHSNFCGGLRKTGNVRNRHMRHGPQVIYATWDWEAEFVNYMEAGSCSPCSVADRGAGYCDWHVSVCLSVRMCTPGATPATRPKLANFPLYVFCGNSCQSVLLWQRCN